MFDGACVLDMYARVSYDVMCDGNLCCGFQDLSACVIKLLVEDPISQ